MKRTFLSFRVVPIFILIFSFLFLYQSNGYATCSGEECFDPSEFSGWSQSGQYYALSKRCSDQFSVTPQALFIFERNRGLIHIIHTEECPATNFDQKVSYTRIVSPPKPKNAAFWQWGVHQLDVSRSKLLKKYHLQPVQKQWRTSFVEKGVHLGEKKKQIFTKKNMYTFHSLFPKRFLEAIQKTLSPQNENHSFLMQQTEITCIVQPILTKEQTQIGLLISDCSEVAPRGIYSAEIIGGYVHPISGDIVIKTMLHESRAATSETFDLIIH